MRNTHASVADDLLNAYQYVQGIQDAQKIDELPSFFMKYDIISLLNRVSQASPDKLCLYVKKLLIEPLTYSFKREHLDIIRHIYSVLSDHSSELNDIFKHCKNELIALLCTFNKAQQFDLVYELLSILDVSSLSKISS
jgi:hypothetical protein